MLRLGRHLQYAAIGYFSATEGAKAQEYRRDKPDVIATGNIGCITQIASGQDIPVVHTIELLNWAYGGKKPDGIELVSGNFRRS